MMRHHQSVCIDDHTTIKMKTHQSCNPQIWDEILDEITSPTRKHILPRKYGGFRRICPVYDTHLDLHKRSYYHNKTKPGRCRYEVRTVFFPGDWWRHEARLQKRSPYLPTSSLPRPETLNPPPSYPHAHSHPHTHPHLHPRAPVPSWLSWGLAQK